MAAIRLSGAHALRSTMSPPRSSLTKTLANTTASEVERAGSRTLSALSFGAFSRSGPWPVEGDGPGSKGLERSDDPAPFDTRRRRRGPADRLAGAGAARRGRAVECRGAGAGVG